MYSYIVKRKAAMGGVGGTPVFILRFNEPKERVRAAHWRDVRPKPTSSSRFNGKNLKKYIFH
jgi:hypothetical protein